MADIYQTAADKHDVDPFLLRAIQMVETGNHPTPDKAVSSAGALGRMQIMPQNFQSVGITDPSDPAQNVNGAAKIFSDFLNAAGGNVPKALMMYNGGNDPAKWNPVYAQKVADAYTNLKKPSAVTADAASLPEDDIIAHLKKGLFVSAPQTASSADDDIISHLRQQIPAVTPPRTGSDAKPDIPTMVIRPSSKGDLLAAIVAQTTGINMKGANKPPPVETINGKPIEEGRPAGMTTQALASLPTATDAQRRIYGNALFPNLPVSEAAAKITVTPSGRFATVDDKGNPYYLDPASPNPLHPSTLLPGNFVPWVAGGAGSSLPVMGGIAGGLVGGPSSLMVGPLGAAAGAAAGDVGRQFLASRIDPAHQPIAINPKQILTEAAMGGGGRLLGSVINRRIAPNPLALPSADVATLRNGGALARAQEAYDRATAQGIHLTPGQATRLPSLLSAEDAATFVIPQSQDAARAFYDRQRAQVGSAGQSMLDRVSPVADKTDAAMQFQQGASDAITAARQQANAAARPSYQAAERVGNVMSPDLAQIADVPAVQQAIAKARAAYQNIYRRAPPDTPDFALWDLTKRQLDDMHGVAARAGERTDAMALDGLRTDLRTHLDAAYPTYADARTIAAPGQQLAARLEDAGTGRTAGMGGDERAKAILAPVFDQNNPRAVAEARSAFTAAGREDEWNAGVRAYIQDAFDAASKGQDGLNPKMLRRQIWSNPNVRDNIRAAMNDTQFKGFDNFLRTVEDVAETYPMNSLTEPRREAANRLIGAAGESEPIRALRMLGDLASPSILNVFRTGANNIADRMTGTNINKITGALFTPDGMAMLKTMAQVDPKSQQAVSLASQFVSRAIGDRSASPTSPQLANPLALPER